MDSLTIIDLLRIDLKEHEALNLKVISGTKGLAAQIHSPNLNRPGLALNGFYDNFAFERIQIIGRGETAYLNKLSTENRKIEIEEMLNYKIPCCIFTHNLEPTKDFIELSDKLQRTVLQTPLSTSELISRLNRFLYLFFAPSQQVHGVMVEVFGLGVLILGESGVGKSEAALALIERGHRLIADDIVKISLVGGNILLGGGVHENSHQMEIRGLGIINISHLFGVGAVLESKNIQLVTRLEEWQNNTAYDRTGLETRYAEFFKVNIREVLIPVKPGRPNWLIIETAAMNERLKQTGYDPTKDLNYGPKRSETSKKIVSIQEW